MFDTARLQQIEKIWEAIEASYRLAPYNAPLNRVEEYQKILNAYHDGQLYNPQFVYKSPPTYPVEQIRDFLAGLRPNHFPFEMIYYEKAQSELFAIQCIQTHDPGIITGTSCLAYGLPDHTLLDEARNILKERVTDISEQVQEFSAEAAAEWIGSVLREVGIQEWQAVVLEPMNARISVNRLDKQVKIRKGSTFSQSDLRRLIIHEIGVHLLRYENGTEQSIYLFRNSFPGYLETEEGLAVYSEAESGLLETETLRKYAGRVIAANLALNHSFGQVFQALASYLGTETAFDITVRSKRGFMDTMQPGAHTKDIVYLKGFLSVRAHLLQHPDDYPLLFIGKFGLQHLPLVRSLLETGTILPAKLLPSNLKINI